MPTIDFHRRFHPLTAHPFDREDCREVPPCAALSPYVRCFWGPVARKGGLVIPDACADILIVTDAGRLDIHFCPVDNTPAMAAHHLHTDQLFAVRFYFWALPYFVRGGFDEENFADLRHFLLHSGFMGADFAGRQRLMEGYLLARLAKGRVIPALMDGVDLLVRTHGRMAVPEVAAHMGVSVRTAERLFRQGTGLTPKETAEVIRYQTLWRRCLQAPTLDLMDQVEELGFYDQAHLLNTFRKFHGLPLREAVRVAFLQDRQANIR